MSARDMSPEDFALGVQATLMAADGTADPFLIDCPKCGGQLRAEMITEYRPAADAAAYFGVTLAEVMASGVRTDAFGRVQCGVPSATCMACGSTYDLSLETLTQ